MTAAYVDAPATSPWLDVLARPVTVAEVLECSVEMLEVLREYLFRSAYGFVSSTNSTWGSRKPLILCRAESSIMHEATI